MQRSSKTSKLKHYMTENVGREKIKTHLKVYIKSEWGILTWLKLNNPYIPYALLRFLCCHFRPTSGVVGLHNLYFLA